MAGLTFLSDDVVRKARTIDGDRDANELLQELRAITGEDWIVRVRTYAEPKRVFHRTKSYRHYALYADCHGEWQHVNLVTSDGGSVFNANDHSREHVMNFMLGYISAATSIFRRLAA